MPRVAVVIIDAAEWSYIERLLAAGALPHLAALRARSAEARLRAPIAYRSELAWTQFLTGQEGRAAGFPASLMFDPRSYDTWAERWVSDTRPFFAFGPSRKVVAFDLIHAMIRDDVEGAQVMSWGAHSPRYPRSSRPAGLLAEIDATVGPHPGFDNDLDSGWYSPAYLEQLASLELEGARRRAPALELAASRVPDWQLLITSMSEIHGAGHHFLHGVDAAHPLYGQATSVEAGRHLDDVARSVDAALGRVLSLLPEDTTVVVGALHGMKPADDLLSMVLFPELLHRHQFGKRQLLDPDQDAWQAAGCPPVVPGADDLWYDLMRDRFVGTARARMLRQLRRRTPAASYELARRLGGRPPRHHLGQPNPIPAESPPPSPGEHSREGFEWQPASWYRRYWQHMPVFVLPTFTDVHLRVNVAGREGAGIVDPAGWRRAAEEVIAFAEQVTDARTGHRLLADVVWLRDHPAEENHADADVLLVWDGCPDAVVHPEVGMVGPFPHARTGSHSANGWAFIAGPGIMPCDLGERSALDLPATVLALLGAGADRPLSGRSLLPPVPA